MSAGTVASPSRHEVLVPTGESENHSCCSCTRPSSITAEKALKIFASIFFISVVAITVTSLIVNYPQASTAFYSVFGTTTFVSIVALAIATYRHWTKGSNGEVLNMTAQVAMKVFASIFVLSVLAVTVNSVIVNYPQASTAIYSIFSIAGSASFIALCVLLVKRCLGGGEDLETDAPSTPPNGQRSAQPSPAKPSSSKPSPAKPSPAKPSSDYGRGGAEQPTPSPAPRDRGAYDGTNPFE